MKAWVSAGVASHGRETRIAWSAMAPSPIASSTWLRVTLPDEQAGTRGHGEASQVERDQFATRPAGRAGRGTWCWEGVMPPHRTR